MSEGPKAGFSFDFRIRKEETRPRKRACDHAGCANEGTHRAPRSPTEPNAFYWFCQPHARAHNESWDYFRGMPEEEVLAFQRDAITGHRPTWRMADRVGSPGAAAARARAHPIFRRAAAANARTRQRRPLPLQAEALATLGLDAGASLNDVRARYKELVKRFHPDANGGDRTAEERLAQVIRAYSTLKTSGYS